MYNALPAKTLRTRNPKFFRNLFGEIDMNKYEGAMKETDKLHDTGTALAHNARVATESLVKAHQSMEDWHGAVRSNIKDLNTLERGVGELRDNMRRDLIDRNFDRLQDFDKLVAVDHS